MTRALPFLLLLLVWKPAAAATLGPASQTLEALRGSAVTDPDAFFDGLAGRVSVVTPSSFVALPQVRARVPDARFDTRFDSRVVAPGVTVHRPLTRSERRAASAESPVSTQALFIVGAALVGVAVLLLLAL